MTYAGNPSLASETKERICTTYNQTLDLAKQGRGQEAALGCDFILKMDPLYSPARELQSALSSGTDVSQMQPVEVAAAQPVAVGAAVVDSVAEAVPMAEAITAEPIAAEPVAMPLDAAPMAEALPVEASPLAAVVVDEPAATAPSGPAESGDRIAELLAEGQQSFDQQSYQDAIDVWSRIFLIDIDHTEAAERIDLARKLKDESERQVDELFHEANAHRDAGRIEEARAAYQRLLDVQPSHLAAAEALERLDSAPAQIDAAPAEGEFEEAQPHDMPPLPDDDFGEDTFDGEFAEPSGVWDPEASTGTGRAAPPASAKVMPPKAQKKGRSFGLIGGLALVGLLAAAFLLWQNKDRLFPNSDPVVEAPAPVLAGPVERAMKLHLRGDTEAAIEVLRGISEEDADYDRAQQQLALWDAEAKEPEPEVEAPDEAQLARRGELIETARSAYDNKEYLRAAKAFATANRIAPLEGPEGDLLRDASRQVRPIRQHLEFFRQKEWERLLPSLWRLREQDPANKDVLRLLIDSHFNLGIRQLQRNDPQAAGELLKEAAQLDRADAQVARVKAFCDAYQARRRDPLYTTFVKQLQFRR